MAINTIKQRIEAVFESQIGRAAKDDGPELGGQPLSAPTAPTPVSCTTPTSLVNFFPQDELWDIIYSDSIHPHGLPEAHFIAASQIHDIEAGRFSNQSIDVPNAHWLVYQTGPQITLSKGYY